MSLQEFLEDHYGEIKGLYADKYYRNGGWNGLMDAIDEVMRRYEFETEEEITEELIDEIF